MFQRISPYSHEATVLLEHFQQLVSDARFKKDTLGEALHGCAIDYLIFSTCTEQGSQIYVIERSEWRVEQDVSDILQHFSQGLLK